MIIRELPRPDSTNSDSQPNLQNAVIWTFTKAKYQYPNHSTPYLLIANFNDTGNYQVNGRHISVSEKSFYFLNAGDKLEINFKNQMPLETLLVLFSDEFIKGWIDYRHTGIGSLLANGSATSADAWNIPNIPFEYNSSIINHLNKVKACVRKEDMEAVLFELLESFWGLETGSRYKLDQIHVKRKSTKEEIYRRLLAAKIFMHDNFNCSPALEAIATEACLDKFHFLKLFKSLYDITPHQYLVQLKLEHAYGLLATGRFTIMETCRHVGFESQGTFTNLFKKHYHFLPSELAEVPQI